MSLGEPTFWTRREDSSEPKMSKITDSLCHGFQVLLDKLAGWLTKENVDFLQCLVLGFWHKEQLVEPSQHGDTAVETERQTNARHGGLHVAEKVCYEPRTEEKRHIRGFHSVAT